MVVDVEWPGAIEGWTASLRAAGRRRQTIALRRYQLGRLAAVVPAGPGAVTVEALVDWLGEQDWDVETRRSFRSALMTFFRWAHRRGLVEVDPAAELARVRPADPDPHPTPEHHYVAAMARGDDRQRLLLRLGAELGLRRGEACQVHVGHDLQRTLHGWTLFVHGKGGRNRTLPVSPLLAAELRRAGPGYAFPGGVDGHLSPAWAGKLVSRLLPPGWAMHSLRHRFATAAHSIEHDLVVVQQLLGHASLVTTQRYVLVLPEQLRRTVEAVGRL